MPVCTRVNCERTHDSDLGCKALQCKTLDLHAVINCNQCRQPISSHITSRSLCSIFPISRALYFSFSCFCSCCCFFSKLFYYTSLAFLICTAHTAAGQGPVCSWKEPTLLTGASHLNRAGAPLQPKRQSRCWTVRSFPVKHASFCPSKVHQTP